MVSGGSEGGWLATVRSSVSQQDSIARRNASASGRTSCDTTRCIPELQLPHGYCTIPSSAMTPESCIGCAQRVILVLLSSATPLVAEVSRLAANRPRRESQQIKSCMGRSLVHNQQRSAIGLMSEAESVLDTGRQRIACGVGMLADVGAHRTFFLTAVALQPHTTRTEKHKNTSTGDDDYDWSLSDCSLTLPSYSPTASAT